MEKNFVTNVEVYISNVGVIQYLGAFKVPEAVCLAAVEELYLPDHSKASLMLLLNRDLI